MESARFQNINTEFLTVMKKVYKSPFVLDVMNQPGIQKSLERLADLLNKIQKALGEYLERERASFPRFYFVGDEDLLEIIGNSKDILRIMKHLKKMFAGISTIILDDDLTQILGLASREGEEVRFKEPISLKDYPKINDWLTKLESEMRRSLAVLLCESVSELQVVLWLGLGDGSLHDMDGEVSRSTGHTRHSGRLDGCSRTSFQQGSTPEGPLNTVQKGLELLADVVLTELAPVTRRKCEHLITELVHQRDVTRTLIQQGVSDNTAFAWLYQMRFYLDAGAANPLDCLSIRVSDTSFPYGWEYLGVPDRLVQTPLTDRCYLTLTQALDTQLGGAPFGPAGTGEYLRLKTHPVVHANSIGKTESVKALGVQLGRFVLVFCCDETFDFQAMGRIFLGLCQVGAWGCFDEFNRLEERILSAVSQQVQTIQQGLAATVKNPNTEIELVGKNLKINPNIGCAPIT
jgi:dynein heavy chain 1